MAMSKSAPVGALGGILFALEASATKAALALRLSAHVEVANRSYHGGENLMRESREKYKKNGLIYISQRMKGIKAAAISMLSCF